MRMFSRPVRFSSTVAYWPARPMMRRTTSGSLTTSWPRMAARPASGSRMVERMRTAVVLPAPLGPSSPSTVPVSTCERDAVEGAHVAAWEHLDEVVRLDGDRRSEELAIDKET